MIELFGVVMILIASVVIGTQANTVGRIILNAFAVALLIIGVLVSEGLLL